MSQLVEDGDTLYVADPEVREINDQYTSLSDFSDTSISGYYSFSNYRNSVLLSGTGKNRFGNYMRGRKIELRTIVQNLSDTVERTIKMKYGLGIPMAQLLPQVMAQHLKQLKHTQFLLGVIRASSGQKVP